MALLSRYPTLNDQIEVFSDFLWSDLPAADLPFPSDGPEAQVLRLSASGHWDVPIRLPNGAVLNLLALHATPPVFDGPEDRNGRRNADQIRFWADYLNGWHPSKGVSEPPSNAVVLGTLNADPEDGDARREHLHRLLNHPALQDPENASLGAKEASRRQRGVNASHDTPAALDTVDWADRGQGAPGNLRVDYVLPTANLSVLNAGVHWPLSGLEAAAAQTASRHRVVWVDLALPSPP